MAKRILIEEFHVCVYIAPELTAKELAAIRRALDGSALQARLRRAARRVLRREPDLAAVTVLVSR